MGERIEDGGPAFPVAEDHKVAADLTWTCGMSLRDYFIAHAPVEPQPWFSPVMPAERPTQPELPKAPDITPLDLAYVREYREVMKPEEGGHPALREHIVAYQTGRKAAGEWDSAAAKARYTQWPAAWADEMLKARRA